jgi:hypothetical protein
MTTTLLTNHDTHAPPSAIHPQTQLHPQGRRPLLRASCSERRAVRDAIDAGNARLTALCRKAAKRHQTPVS